MNRVNTFCMLPTISTFHDQVPQYHAIRGLKLCAVLVQSNTNQVSMFQGTMYIATVSIFPMIFPSLLQHQLRQNDKFQNNSKNVFVLSHLCSVETHVYII